MSETMSGEHRRPAWVDLSLALSLAAAVIGFINVWSFAHGNTETLQVMLGAGGLGWTFTVWLAASIPVLLAASWLLLAVMLGEGLREDDPWIQPLLALGSLYF